MAENFDLIFGQNASQQYAWSDNDYQNGWGTVGSIPPTAAQFDALQRRADLKAQDLNNRLAPIEENDTHDYRQPSTAYAVGNIAYHASLPTGWYLECTAAGETGSGELTITNPTVGGAVSDGAVTWTIRKTASTNDITNLSVATQTTNGLMSATDKTKLDGIEANANNYSLPAATGSVRGGVKVGSNISLSGDTISVSNSNVQNALGFNPAPRVAATQSAAGLMSAADKTKLDGIAAGANNYSLPAATGSVRGGVTVGSNISLSGDKISLTSGNVTNALGYTPPSTTGANASGSWNINSATATKLATPRAISLTGKAAGSTTFDGSSNAAINVKSVNADTASKLSTARKINIIGNASGSAAFDGSGDISINTTVNESKHAVNADTATHANDVTDAVINYGASGIDNNATAMASGVINDLESLTGSNDLTSMNKLRSFVGSVYTNDWYDVISIRHRNGAGDGREYGLLMYSTLTNTGSIKYKKQRSSSWTEERTLLDSWTEERTLLDSSNYNSYAPTKTGAGASGTWNISVSGNAASATNADKVDGYHASDLLRTLGGNKAPVMTDIFDRAGTIDLSAMNATDKANNKAKINKSCNSLQNIWNTSTGIAAYGGDIDMSGGYHKGTLKLTQSYKNFDKILVVGTNDDGNIVFYKLWNVYELIYAFSHSFRFPLYNDGAYWNVYGSVRTGTATNYVLSTDTIWSCYDQGAGIIAIYGIKY